MCVVVKKKRVGGIGVKSREEKILLAERAEMGVHDMFAHTYLLIYDTSRKYIPIEDSIHGSSRIGLCWKTWMGEVGRGHELTRGS